MTDSPVIPITAQLLEEAADVLGTALVDDPLATFLVPDPRRALLVQRLFMHAAIEEALDNGGRVDGIGHPIVGVAIWLRRPPIDEPEDDVRQPPSPARLHAREALRAGLERAELFGQAMRRLRERARPDRHAYLDSIGVLSEHRRHGLASTLLAAGHAWADAERLPCCLDTLTDANVAFYELRGYAVVDEEPVPDADFRIVAMRRVPSGR
jgi:ribosomal protein S18 acetylase RimI-like enzyme